MSSLKYQLRAILPSLCHEVHRVRDEELKRRFYLIKAVCDSNKDIKKVCESRGMSRDLFYKWSKRLLEDGLFGLKSRSRRPSKSPKLTDAETTQAIIEWRDDYPYMGPERISFYLKFEKGIECAPSTVYRVLVREGLISQKLRSKRSKKHLKRYRRPCVGYLQLDIKYVPYLVKGMQFYQFSVIDHHSSWRFIRIYKKKDVGSLLKFLHDMEKVIPFSVIQIQTDNDMAFTDKFWTKDNQPSGKHPLDRWCEWRGVEHKLIPIGEKELNGKVENSHKYDDEEFYSQTRFRSYKSICRQIAAYNKRWNEWRRTKALFWQTPQEVAEKSAQKRMIGLLVIIMKHDPATWGILKRAFTEQKPKKLTLAQRYINYVDGITRDSA